MQKLDSILTLELPMENQYQSKYSGQAQWTKQRIQPNSVRGKDTCKLNFFTQGSPKRNLMIFFDNPISGNFEKHIFALFL